MKASNYLCHVVGENPERVARYHPSTVRRVKAFALAIHIPVLIWATISFLIATHIFGLEQEVAMAVAVGSATLIYLVERLVLATPKSWWVSVGRFVLGIVIAVLGASTVDLIIFDREIKQQLFSEGLTRIETQYVKDIDRQEVDILARKVEWTQAKDAAACEANGTCGSRVASIGPIYRELEKRAGVLRADYVASKQKRDAISAEKARTITDWTVEKAGQEAGLLARVEALHQFIKGNRYALVAYCLFFVIVVFFELMVILVKLTFKDTVDDELERVHESVSEHKAKAYKEMVISPIAPAIKLLQTTYA